MGRFHNLTIKIFLSYILLVFLVLGIVTTTYYSAFQRNFIRQAEKALENEIKILIPILRMNLQEKKSDSQTIPVNIRLLDNLFKADFIFIYGQDRRHIYSKGIADLAAQSGSRQEILETVNASRLNPRGTITLAGKQYIYVQQSVPINDKRGILILISALEGVQELRQAIMPVLLFSFLLASLLGLLLSYFLARKITAPIKQLTKSVESFAGDNDLISLPVTEKSEVGQLAKSFMNMLSRLKQYNESQVTFLQNISHDLKTPLMSIQAYSEGIKDKVIQGDEIEKTLDIIINQAKRMKNQIEKISSLSKAENRDNYHFGHIKLSTLIADVVDTISPIAYQKGITISTKIKQDQTLRLDKEKMSSALLNIIDNGLRYAASKIEITTDEEEGFYTITITDDGPGIPFEDAGKIFERSYKGKNGKSGLGLAIAKAIVQNHQGVIQAHNSPNGGACFKISF